MLKCISSVTLVIVLLSRVHAQQTFVKIPIGDIATGFDALKIQALNIDDSVLIASTDTKRKDSPKAYWILPDGNSMKITNSEINGKIFVCLDRIGDSTYFYYLEEQRNYIVLRALVQSNQTGVLINSPKKIVFIGTFLNLFRADDQHLYLVSVVKDKNEIHVVEVSDLVRVSEKIVVPRVDLKTNESPFVFVKEGETPSPVKSASLNKIFQRGHFLYLDIDRIHKLFDIPRKSSFTRIDLQAGTLMEREIIDAERMDFRTYIEDAYIFKISKSRSDGCIVNIYDLESLRVVKTFAIDKSASFAKERAIKRGPLVSHNKESVRDAISNHSSGFITATVLDSGRVILKLGSNHVNIPTLYVPFPHFSLLGAFISAVTIASLAINDPKAVDQYLYVKWDGKDNFTFSDQPVSVDQLIDAYDIGAFTQRIKFTYKAHVPLRNKVIGIYHAVGSPSLDIIRFEVSK